MTRHNLDSIAGSLVLLGSGTALILLSRRSGVRWDMMSHLAAGIGPIAVVLGVGMAVHGRTMPLNRISLPARIWGLVGSAAASAHLWALGYFTQVGAASRAARWLVPGVLIGVWFLPARFFGEVGEEQPSQAAEPPTEEQHP